MSNFWTIKQKENIDFFNSKLNELLKDPILRNKFLIIYNKEIKGSYDSFETAIKYAATQFPKDEFIIQQVISDNDTNNFLYSAIAL